MARKSNPSLAQHADALENMARDVAREHSISLSEARSRVRAELQAARSRALSTTSVEGRRRPNPIPLEPPPHVAHDLAKLSDASLRANHDRAQKQINTGAPAKRDAANRLVCWSLWEAHRRGLQFDRSAAAAPTPRSSNPVTGKYGFGADGGKMAPMPPRSPNPHGHYLDVVLGDRDTIFIDEVPVAHVGEPGDAAYWSDQSDAGSVLHLMRHGRHYAGQVPYGLRPMQIRLVTHPHPSRQVLGMPHPGHNHCRICSEKLPPGASVCSHHASAPMDERWDDLPPGGRTSNPVGTRNSAMGTRVTRTRHLNENGEYDVRHWVHGEMVGDYGTPLQEDAIEVQRYLTGEHHGHPRPDIQKFLGERHGPTPCRDDGRFCGGEKAPSKRKGNPTTPAKPKTDWNQTKLSAVDKSFVRMVMGNVHVGTTEEEVVREWAQRKTLRDHLDTPLAHALINQALDQHWENVLVYNSVTRMRRLPKTRPSKGQPLPGLPPVRKQAPAKPKALPASKAPPMLPPAPHDRGDNPIGHWKY